ncbi:Cytochrome b562 [Pseudoalteromonas sp. P1-9]|uniref:cytochrome b562 n=1 Tax=Pseudoalteromonas sp. P1-9 TaxID=1710354 RepID=UPI0006D64D31|nr:cytochrome b562 [Pseudoalteromonas sp. P1-9]KPV95671.1 Cytochrome b562 [Pseudoalteromonas sp. P1-9]
MKKTFLLSIFIMCFSLSAEQSELALVMKEMALSYKQAKTAQTSDELLTHLTDIENALRKSQQIGFNRESEKSNQGIERVLKHVALIKQNVNDLPTAKKQLTKIDKLRKQYHKIHEPSFWQLLFGN